MTTIPLRTTPIYTLSELLDATACTITLEPSAAARRVLPRYLATAMQLMDMCAPRYLRWDAEAELSKSLRTNNVYNIVRKVMQVKTVRELAREVRIWSPLWKSFVALHRNILLVPDPLFVYSSLHHSGLSERVYDGAKIQCDIFGCHNATHNDRSI